MECLALAKMTDQNNQTHFIDDLIGKINIKTKNKHYNTPTFVDYIIQKSYKKYNKKEYGFTEKDLKTIIKWVYGVIDDVKFDPRKTNVLAAEQFFNFEIKKDWAKLDNGTYLSVIGTMDLVIENDGFIELQDWKTGKKINYGTMKEKTFDDFIKDFQGRLYHYALRKLYPENKNVLVTINYINSSPVTIAHDDSNIAETERLLKNMYEKIKKCKNPRLKSQKNSHFFCRSICYFGKNYIGNDTICQYIKDNIDKNGMELTTANLREKGFTLNDYQRG
jgi:hypothetical protein